MQKIARTYHISGTRNAGNSLTAETCSFHFSLLREKIGCPFISTSTSPSRSIFRVDSFGLLGLSLTSLCPDQTGRLVGSSVTRANPRPIGSGRRDDPSGWLVYRAVLTHMQCSACASGNSFSYDGHGAGGGVELAHLNTLTYLVTY